MTVQASKAGWRGGLVAASAALALTAGAAAAAPSGPVVMSGSVAPLDEAVKVLGAAPAQAEVRFQVALRLRDYEGLAASNAKGRVMSFAELKARHLPTQAAYDRVLNWLNDAGLRVDKTSSDRLTVTASGPVAVVSRALGAHFVRVQSEGRELVSADAPPALPRAIAGVVTGINGLQPQLRAHKMSREVHADSVTGAPFYPQAFLSAYSADGVGAQGKRTTTAIVIDTFPLESDLKTYWQTVGSSQSIKRISFIQAVDGQLPGQSGEESMDVEVASAIAPKSKVRVYASRTLSFTDLDTTFERLISDMEDGVKITQVSISLGACEIKVPRHQKKTDDGFFAVMSSLGASVFVSSGDSGSAECGRKRGDTVSFFASSPNVTAVGGTALNLNGDGSVSSETAWSGSGGGVSQFFAAPDYQAGLGYDMRTLPDISADAAPNTGALVIVHGRSQTIGGTSLSAPILAGLTALINANLIKLRKDPVGLINSRLYELKDSSFRDIDSGSNGGFDAGPGYDLVTGLGAPITIKMVKALKRQP